MDLLQSCCSSRELFDKVLSCIQHVIIVTDVEGHCLFTNPVAERVLGFTPEELKGKNLSIIFTPEDSNCLYSNLLSMAHKNKPFEGELMLMRKDGTRFFAFMVFQPYFDPGQGETGIVVSIQDIDKQKDIEKKFGDAHYEDLVKIANGIAHELRNPLMGIGGCIKRLYESCRGGDDSDKYYDHIINNVKRIEGLIKKVEFFVRLPGPCFTEESIVERIEAALQPYLAQIEEQKIDLTVNMEEVILRTDKNLVVSGFSILMENALDALSAGGKLLIHSETKDNQYQIHVTDTGCGIAPEDLPYIFNPFFSTKADGVGIDLAVVKRIVDSHGGQVEVRSKQGEGTTFLLMFPLERRRSIRASRLQG